MNPASGSLHAEYRESDGVLAKALLNLRFHGDSVDSQVNYDPFPLVGCGDRKSPLVCSIYKEPIFDSYEPRTYVTSGGEKSQQPHGTVSKQKSHRPQVVESHIREGQTPWHSLCHLVCCITGR